MVGIPRNANESSEKASERAEDQDDKESEEDAEIAEDAAEMEEEAEMDETTVFSSSDSESKEVNAANDEFLETLGFEALAVALALAEAVAQALAEAGA